MCDVERERERENTLLHARIVWPLHSLSSYLKDPRLCRWADRISPPPRRFVKRTTRVLARSGTFVRIRAGIGYITHTRVMHQVMYEVSTHRPRPTRLVNSSDSQPVPRRREGGSTRLSPRAIGVIRTLPGWGGGVHTAAGHLRTPTMERYTPH